MELFHPFSFLLGSTWLLLFCWIQTQLHLTSVSSFTFNAVHQFDAAQYSNPQIAPSQVETQLTVRFDHTDATAYLDSENGFCFEMSLPTSTGTMVNGEVCITYGPLLSVRSNTVLGTMPMKMFKIQSFVRDQRSNHWFVTQGSIATDPNVQSVLQALNAANGTGVTPLGRRLLEFIQSGQEVDARVQKLGKKYFTTDRDELNLRSYDIHDQYQKRLDFRSNLLTVLRGHTSTFLESLGIHPPAEPGYSRRYTRGLKQTVGTSPTNTITFSPTAVADIDQFQPALTNFLNGPAVQGGGGLISQGTAELQLLNSVVNQTTTDLLQDTAILTRTANITGAQYLIFQQNQNATEALQIQQLEQNQDTTNLANNRTQWIQQDENQHISTLNNYVFNFQVANDFRYNATLQWLNLMNLTTTQYGLYAQTNYITLQSDMNLADLTNERIVSFYTKVDVHNAQTYKWHQLVAEAEALGYKVVASTSAPAPAPKGYVPLSSNNLGYMYRSTALYTTVQSGTAAAFYNDVDMAAIPDYNNPSNVANNAYFTKLGGSGSSTPVTFLHMKRVAIFCSNEWLLSQQNKIFKYYDLLAAIGPTGCTPYTNCQCWAVVNRQKCTTFNSAQVTTSNIPAPKTNIWDNNGCQAGTSGGQTESLQWFGTSTTASITGRLASETLTNAAQVAAELQWDCTFILTQSPQTSATIPTDVNPYVVYHDYGQMTAPNSATASAILTPNNYLWCGTDPQVMMDQSRMLNASTYNYNFVAGMKFALQSLLANITGVWNVEANGDSDRNVGRYTKPFHTNKRMYQRIFATDIAFTSTSAIPVNLLQTLGKGQVVNVTVKAGGTTYPPFQLTGSQIRDLSPTSWSFPLKQFILAGWKDCWGVIGGCPSPDPGFFPATNYGYNTPWGTTRTLSASNTTQLRMKATDILIDLTPSLPFSPYIICPWTLFYGLDFNDPNYDPRCNNPNNVNPPNANPPQYYYNSPPPVIDIDFWNQIYKQDYFDPNTMMGDSIHWYAVPIYTDPIKGELSTGTSPYQSASTDVFPDGILDRLFGVETPYGPFTGFPTAMDSYELSFWNQKRYITELTFSIPGTLVAVTGPTMTVCPPPTQMKFDSTNGAWVQIYLTNGYAQSLQVTINFVSFEDPTNCNKVYTATITPGTTYSRTVPSCVMQNMTVLSYDPVSQTNQECWFFFGNMTQVFLDQYKPPSAPPATTLGDSTIISDPTTTEIINNADLQYKLNLYQQQMIVLTGLQLQLPLLSNMAGIIGTLPSVSGGNVAVPIGSLLPLSNTQQDILNINSQVNTLLVQSTANAYRSSVTASGLNTAVSEAIGGAVAAYQNASQVYADLQATIEANEPLLANITGAAAQQNLLELQQKTDYFSSQVYIATLANASLIWYEPELTGGTPIHPEWSSDLSVWGEIYGGLEGILDDLIALGELLLNLTHPSCSILGSASQLICNIFNILKWIILILFILALIFIAYKIYTWYQQRQQTANLNKLIYSQTKISEKASVPALKMTEDDVSTEHTALLASSGPTFQAMPFSVPRSSQSYTSTPNSATRESSTLLIGSSASSTTQKNKITSRKNMFDY